MTVPDLPPSLPRRGGPVWRALGRWFLALCGWRIEGNFPDRPQQVVIVAPHTSNWDFVFGIAAVFALGLEAHWLGKHTLFRGPAGWLARRLGGIPIDRRHPQGSIGTLAGEFRCRERLVLGITPEGTRSRVERWKSGFYRIAEATGAPIVLGYLDFGRRVAGIGPVIEPSGDLERDLEEILAFYRGVTPRRPERFNPTPVLSRDESGG